MKKNNILVALMLLFAFVYTINTNAAETTNQVDTIAVKSENNFMNSFYKRAGSINHCKSGFCHPVLYILCHSMGTDN